MPSCVMMSAWVYFPTFFDYVCVLVRLLPILKWFKIFNKWDTWLHKPNGHIDTCAHTFFRIPFNPWCSYVWWTHWTCSCACCACIVLNNYETVHLYNTYFTSLYVLVCTNNYDNLVNIWVQRSYTISYRRRIVWAFVSEHQIRRISNTDLIFSKNVDTLEVRGNFCSNGNF